MVCLSDQVTGSRKRVHGPGRRFMLMVLIEVSKECTKGKMCWGMVSVISVGGFGCMRGMAGLLRIFKFNLIML